MDLRRARPARRKSRSLRELRIDQCSPRVGGTSRQRAYVCLSGLTNRESARQDSLTQIANSHGADATAIRRLPDGRGRRGRPGTRGRLARLALRRAAPRPVSSVGTAAGGCHGRAAFWPRCRCWRCSGSWFARNRPALRALAPAGRMAGARDVSGGQRGAIRVGCAPGGRRRGTAVSRRHPIQAGRMDVAGDRVDTRQPAVRRGSCAVDDCTLCWPR